MSTITTGPVVVGLESGRVTPVLPVATGLARRLGTSIVCTTVDPALFFIGLGADGGAMMQPIDPDLLDLERRELPPEDIALAERIAAEHGVAVEFLPAAGDPSHALSRVAEERDASFIVVGTRSGRHRVTEFLTGSVAARLTHQQHRPVVVVPVEPNGFDDSLPWAAS